MKNSRDDRVLNYENNIQANRWSDCRHFSWNKLIHKQEKKVKTHDSPKEFPRKYQEINYRVLQIKFQEKSIMGKQSSQRYVQQWEFSNYLLVHTRQKKTTYIYSIYKYYYLILKYFIGVNSNILQKKFWQELNLADMLSFFFDI